MLQKGYLDVNFSDHVSSLKVVKMLLFAQQTSKSYPRHLASRTFLTVRADTNLNRLVRGHCLPTEVQTDLL